MKYFSAYLPLLIYGRTPHGVRGLKLDHKEGAVNLSRVAPRTGCVD